MMPRPRTACARPAWRRVVRAGVAAAALATLAVPGLALAHAALVKAEPAKRATLSKPPAQVRLWFNERLEPAYASVVVLDAAKVQVSKAAAQVDKADPKLLVLELPALAPGQYTVKYRVLSVDGHTVDYGYTFTLKAPAAGK
jgi:copper resistance protein C